MAAKYWIKLYHEILHDRKMAQLEHRLWRRIIECFLLAGECDRDGFLPKLEDIAWTLRVSVEELETDYNELIRIGILEYRNELYYVRKFAERQSPMPKREYMQRKRNEEQLQGYYRERYQSVTNGNAEEIREDKNRSDADDTAAAVFSHYENNIGGITKTIADRIDDAIKDYSSDWIIEAIDEAVVNNARSWKYTEAILKRWKRDGFKSDNRKKPQDEPERKAAKVYT